MEQYGMNLIDVCVELFSILEWLNSRIKYPGPN